MGLLDLIKKVPAVERSLLDNQIKREQLSANKRRRSAIGDIQGILGNGMNPQAPLLPSDSPVAQQRIMSLLGDVSPDAFAQSLLGSMGPTELSSDAKRARDFGFPSTPEGLAAMKASENSLNPADAARLDQLNLQNQQIIADRDAQAEADTLDKRLMKFNTDQLLSEAMSAYELAGDVYGTMSETGQPFPEIRSALSGGLGSLTTLFGSGEEAAQKARLIRSKYEKLEKSLARLTEAQISRMGGSTDQSRAGMADMMPNVGMLPETIQDTLATVVNGALKESDIYGYGFDRENYSKLLKPWTQRQGWSGLNKEQQQQIQQLWPKMTASERLEFIRGR